MISIRKVIGDTELERKKIIIINYLQNIPIRSKTIFFSLWSSFSFLNMLLFRGAR